MVMFHVWHDSRPAVSAAACIALRALALVSISSTKWVLWLAHIHGVLDSGALKHPLCLTADLLPNMHSASIPTPLTLPPHTSHTSQSRATLHTHIIRSHTSFPHITQLDGTTEVHAAGGPLELEVLLAQVCLCVR